MKGQIPTNVLNGICISVIELQDKVDGKRDDNNGRKVEKKLDLWAKSKSLLSDSKVSLCVAEFVGTAMLLFFGCMGCITEYESMPVPHYMPALTFGLTVMLIIQVFGHISGAHLNPAVTMVTVIFGHLDVVTAALYLVGQFTGAVMGLATLKLLMPPQYVAQEFHDPETNTTRVRLGLCTTTPHPNISTMQALMMETIITAVLILVCCAIWDKRNEHKQDSIPIRFGLVISTIAMSAGPFTGASMNTARSFAPAVLNGDWEHQWSTKFVCTFNKTTMTEADAGAKRIFGKETLAKCAAEFLASAMLLFFGCMGCIVDYEVAPVAHHMPALTFGLTVLLAVHIFAHISGAHISPTITLVAALFGHLDAITALIYIAGQFAGAIFGLGSLKMLVPAEYTSRTVFDAKSNSTINGLGFCVTAPLPNVSSIQALGIEAVITGVLILICCSIWDKRNDDKHDSVAIRLGLAIAAMAMAAAPFSGGSMNTARSFAPALLSGNWEHQWIYWVGPQLGGVATAYLYKYLFALEDQTVGENEGEVEPLNSTKEEVA